VGKKKKFGATPAWVALGLGGAVALHSMVPDSTRGLFLRGQQLENLGQYRLALRAYRVLTKLHPESPWAAQALNRQAAILVALGRDSGDVSQLREAMNLYREVAHKYPTSPFAGEALIFAGDIAFMDLKDWSAAKAIYADLLDRFPGSPEYASQATVKLGRVALAQRDREGARKWFQNVLLNYPKLAERCAEAQFHLGVLYETLWNDPQHKQWARNAYQATFKLYPQSIYAGQAKDRLGLLFFDEASRTPSSRRVLVNVPPISDDILAGDEGTQDTSTAGTDLLDSDAQNGSMGTALRLLLASRGLDVDEVVLRGWSLRPFVAGLDPAQPGRVVGAASTSDWERVLDCAGLRYVPSSGGKAGEALRDLQKELDLARPPLLFNGRWSLAVGYDSSRGLVFLQSQGARIERVSTSELAKTWDVDAPIGSHFAIIGAWAAGEKPLLPDKAGAGWPSRFEVTPTPRALDDPVPTPAPTATPLPGLDTATYQYTLPALSMQAAHARAMSRASNLLARPSAGRVLLGAEALEALANAFDNAARRSQVLEARPSVANSEHSTSGQKSEPGSSELPARASSGAPDGESPLPASEGVSGTQPQPAPKTQPQSSPTQPNAPNPAPNRPVPVDGAAQRAQGLRAWFDEPLSAWLQARRDGAAFCAIAAEQNHKPEWQRASDELKASISALEGARAAMPQPQALQLAPGQNELPEPTRAALREVARLLRQARDSERRAASLMRQ